MMNICEQVAPAADSADMQAYGLECLHCKDKTLHDV